MKFKIIIVALFLLLNQTSFAAETNIENLEPASFWGEFFKIISIHRPSKSEQQIGQHIADIAAKLGYQHHIDEFNNLLVTIPATANKEHLPGIILQSHLDMVPAARSGSGFVWGKDPIKPVIKDGWLTGETTNIGADNGVGVAAMVSLMKNPPASHGLLELIFTADEEVDFSGVYGLKPGTFKGSYLLNLDSEESGEFNVGCAGGQADTVEMATEESSSKAPATAIEITLTHGRGGHSGVDIHRGRANAIVELFRVLKSFRQITSLQLALCSGGTTDTAIPAEARVTLCLPVSFSEKAIKNLISQRQKSLTNRFSQTDGDLKLDFSYVKTPEKLMSEEASNRLISFVNTVPSGILAMSRRYPGNVQTSMNPGVLSSEKNSVKLVTHLQGSTLVSIAALSRRLKKLTESLQMKHSAGEPYRPWEPEEDTSLVDAAVAIHQKVAGKLPILKVVHAGVECGELQHIFPHIKMLSFGPDIRSAHSPDEMVKIDTVEIFITLLNALIEQLPEMMQQKQAKKKNPGLYPD